MKKMPVIQLMASHIRKVTLFLIREGNGISRFTNLFTSFIIIFYHFIATLNPSKELKWLEHIPLELCSLQ